MKKVTYRASANFDIEETLFLCADDYCDELSLWLGIIADLETRHGLKISFERKGEVPPDDIPEEYLG